MNGADSVFEEISIQHRTNNAYTYTCVRGYFEKPLISCQIIDCDNVTTAIVNYVKSKDNPEIDSANHLEIIYLKH